MRVATQISRLGTVEINRKHCNAAVVTDADVISAFLSSTRDVTGNNGSQRPNVESGEDVYRFIKAK